MNDFRERVPLVLAIAATVAWVGLVGIYLHGLGFYAVMQMPPVQLATLLGACGGPLAALWLVVAVFEHRRETKHLARRMGEMITQTRQTVQQSEVQARALLQLLGQASRTQSAEAREMALHDLATNAAVLAERLGVITRDNINAAWARYGAGHETVFVQSFLAFAATHPELTERMAEAVARDMTARVALGGFVRRYEQLRAALPSDEKVMREILEDGALGRAYRLFKAADDIANGGPDTTAADLAALSKRLDAAAPVGAE